MEQATDTVRGSAEMWLQAAYDSLVEGGVDAVRVQLLGKRLNLSRTSFYCFFKDREQLLVALLNRWKSKNTDHWIERTEAYADSVCEAVLNVADCWFDQTNYDSRLEAAIRAWAQQSPEVARETADADTRRIAALKAVFIRFDYAPAMAEIRAKTMYYTQLGYVSTQPNEDIRLRLSRIADYVEVFTGTRPAKHELDRFFSRRKAWPTDSIEPTTRDDS